MYDTDYFDKKDQYLPCCFEP